MKRKLLALLLVFTLVLSACTTNKTEDTKIETTTETKVETTSESTQVNEEKEVIVTSFFPIYDLTRKLVGDTYEVVNLTKSGSAHGFEPTIQDMELISKAKLLIVNGAEFEEWLDNVVENFPSLNVLDLSKSIQLMEWSEVEVLDDHDHDHDHDHESHDEHDHDHDHESHDEHDHDHDHDHHHDIDPHYWLNPSNAIVMLDTIFQTVLSLENSDPSVLDKNHLEVKEQFSALQNDFSTKLSEHAGKSIVVPHSAFSYLFTPYNIKQVGIEGLNSTSEPNATRMAEIVDFLRHQELATVFYEYGDSDKIASTIAQEIGGEALPIATLEVVSEDDIAKGDDYISLMKMNLENILRALEGR